MYISKFAHNTPGRLVQVEGVSGITHAFLPKSLPPKWSWPTALWPLLMEAHMALSRLDGMCKHFPEAKLLLSPLQSREAVKSYQLEGLFTIPEKQLLFQINPERIRSKKDLRNTYRAIYNYEKTLQVYGSQKNRTPDTLPLIRKLHKALLKGIQEPGDTSGVFRTQLFKMSKAPHYVPTPPAVLMRCLNFFEKYLRKKTHYDPLVNAFLIHYQFEAIHPFQKWNGPVSRLLLSVMLAKACGHSNPWIHMSAYFDQHAKEYRNRLFYVSSEGKWEDWIAFCLKGVIAQAKDTEIRYEKLLALSDEFKKSVSRIIDGGSRIQMIARALFSEPIVNVSTLTKTYAISKNTAKSYLNKLIKTKMLLEIDHPSEKTYYAPKILTLIHHDNTE
ncbi:MAG: Fic family protein [Nitrospirae bacterium]|nr:Fic family protein [Candidatus Manganitrophaceae bacterium]